MFSYRIHRRLAFAAVSFGAIALAGCQTAPVGSSAPPVPELKLLESQPLTLAEGCEASGSYFVEFTVLSDGHTGNIQAPASPACVQQALTAWVGTFRYAPPGQLMPAGVEWMMVTGRRGP
ncbi:MAG TPA: hypothetical protein VGE08_08210 [Steroidobacter sp.]|uniref:hypothetical protein n=1 Tax=Steroidobacter sp. TaxID=1978227 RepID=UPI002ED9839C